MADLEKVLEERSGNYGPFSGHADCSQALKKEIRNRLALNDNFRGLSGVKQHAILEGLDMIAHKIGRICNGNPTLEDSWVDIEGYAKITNKVLKGEL